MRTFRTKDILIKLKLAFEIFKVFSLFNIPSVYKSSTVSINGVTVSYLKEGKGESLLLIHGWGHSKEIWNSIIPMLSKKYTVYAIDLPNFGDSSKAQIHIVSEYSSILKDFMQKLNIKKYSIVGHSFGAKVATSLFALDSMHAKNIVLYSANITPSHGKLKNFLIFGISYIYSYALGTAQGKTSAVNARYKTLRNSHTEKGLLSNLKRLERGKDILFIGGKHDFIASHTLSRDYIQKIPNAKRIIFEQSSHLAHKEEPNQFITELDNFLSRAYLRK